MPDDFGEKVEESADFEQRNFRKVLRSALYDARGIVSIDMEEQRIKRREFLSLYRWANNGKGLAL